MSRFEGASSLRLVEVAVTYTRSGTEKVAEEIALRCGAEGAQVTCVLPAIPALDGMDRDLRAAGIGVERFGDFFAVNRQRAANFAGMVRVLRKLRPDIVHFHVPWAPAGAELVAAAFVAGCRCVVRTEHNPITSRLPLAQRWKLRALDARVAAIVFVSEGNRRRHARNGRHATGREIVIPNGIRSPEHYVLSDAERARVRAELGYSPNEVVAVMLANLERRKGPLDFVQVAARTSADDTPALRFAVIGDGPEREAAERLAVSLGVSGRLRFLGRRSDVPKIMGAFDIFVQPSHHEGLSLAMLEALAAGLPMVSTDVDGVEEVVGRDTEPGIISPIGDVAGLANGVASLARDAARRQRFGAELAAQVRTRFTIEHMCTRYMELYQRLLLERRS